MSDKLALLIWAATPDRPELIATPLVHALAARALDAEVEIHFAGPAIRWLFSDTAITAYPTPEREKSVRQFLDEVLESGASLFVCSMARAAWSAPEAPLIDARIRAAGATAFVARTLEPAWKTLVF